MTECRETRVTIISQNRGCPFSSEWYDIASADHFWMQWRFRVLLAFIKRLGVSLQKELSVLEIGCGRGVLLSQMEAKTRWKIDGADLNFRSLTSSVSERSGLLFYDVLERRREFKQRYDMVILVDVLEHIETPTEFLKACHFHLCPGGIFIVNVPALQSMYSVYDRAMGHLRRYNNKMLKMELEILGGDRLVTSYWGMTMLPLLFSRKFLLSFRTARKDIVKGGFKPPSGFVHRFLKLLMWVECTFWQNPPIGTSLMGAVVGK